ncbi:hypothetical protein PDPE_1-03219 [Photobacterium damselae subsp. piscicida]|nr:hypothetical protein PDPE_1-03219 [Photobacterium damselae subsp. piscicida]
MSKMVLAILLAVLVAFFLYRSYTNKQLAAENIKQGEAFLAENKTWRNYNRVRFAIFSATTRYWHCASEANGYRYCALPWYFGI